MKFHQHRSCASLWEVVRLDIKLKINAYERFCGGLNGQASACLHGISRELLQIDPDCRTSLKSNGYLTRDSRMVERKKYGQRGARRRFQFSKR